MLSCGVSIENVSKFRAKDENFLRNTYTPKELRFCYLAKNPSYLLAQKYCAKNAILKAFCALNVQDVSILDIEILENNNSIPYVKILTGDFENCNINLSYDSDEDRAIAFAVIEY